MGISRQADKLIPLLERDVIATVGPRYRHVVQSAAANVRTLESMDDGDKIIEDVQQYFHDTFVDTTWPACPRHSRHPLWYRDGAWWSEQDTVAVLRIGDLESRGQ